MESLTHPEDARLGVWIDHSADTGDGLSVEICPAHFALAEDSLPVVTDGSGRVLGLSIDGLVVVDPEFEKAVIEVAEEVADENVYVHYVRTDDQDNITHIWDIDENAWQPWTIQPSYPDIGVYRLRAPRPEWLPKRLAPVLPKEFLDKLVESVYDGSLKVEIDEATGYDPDLAV